jgi:hypothetical protein
MKLKTKRVCSWGVLLTIAICTGCRREFMLGERVAVVDPMANGTGTVVDVKSGIDMGHDAPGQVYYKIQSGPMTNEFRMIGHIQVNMREMNQVWMPPKYMKKINTGNNNSKLSDNSFSVGECVAVASANGDEKGKVVNIEMGMRLNHQLDAKGMYYKIQFGADTNDTDGFWIDSRLIKRIQ